jgi:predicted lipoprotein with Yx(FWY)xxD motif
MRYITKTAAWAVAAVLCAATAGGCSDDKGSSSSSSSSAEDSSDKPSRTVKLRSGPLGKILVDGKGRTLYLFEKEKTRKSRCSGGCADAWPPLVVSGKPRGSKGVKADLLGTTGRHGGDKQVTYHGHPLYRYARDHKADETNGQRLDQFGAKWYALDADGDKITRKPGKSKKKRPDKPEDTTGGY